jgi:hypothetical protein
MLAARSGKDFLQRVRTLLSRQLLAADVPLDSVTEKDTPSDIKRVIESQILLCGLPVEILVRSVFICEIQEHSFSL